MRASCSPRASMDSPVWRRSAARDEHQHPTGSTPPPRKTRRPPASVTLLPITPVHAIPSGALDLDEREQRVVYLAPLTTTAAEKYFMRVYGIGHGKDDKDSDDEDDDDDDDNCQVDGSVKHDQIDHSRNDYHDSLYSPNQSHSSLEQATKSPLRILLAKIERRERKRVLQEAARKLNQAGGSKSHGQLTAASPKKSPSDPWDDEQMQRMKHKVRLMPITDGDRIEFWQTLRNYQRLQLEHRKTMLRDHASPMGFNMEAAWNKTLREKRHQLWVQQHEVRAVTTQQRKLEEDEKFDRRIMESTTEYRTKMRMLKEVRQRLCDEVRTILPTILLSAATQHLLDRLLLHWKQRQLQIRLRVIIRFWRCQRSSHNEHTRAVCILINWLQKSVGVKTVAFRVFRGIRNYVRRVKKLQRLWRIKQAKRRLSYLLLEKMWIHQETLLIDAATDEYEKRQLQIQQEPGKKKKRRKGQQKPDQVQDNADNWLTFVDPVLRSKVIEEFIQEKETEYTSQFRKQEEDLLPHLIETLRGEHPNRARSYIRALAAGIALLGRVHATLQQFHGAVDDVPPIVHFNMRNAPVADLIRRAKERSLPDTTGARFGL